MARGPGHVEEEVGGEREVGGGIIFLPFSRCASVKLDVYSRGSTYVGGEEEGVTCKHTPG